MYRKAASVMDGSKGFMAACYFNFVDVGAYGLPRQMARPNWINVVREPISRYISHFYYMARDWRMQNKVLDPEDAKVKFLNDQFNLTFQKAKEILPQCGFQEFSITQILREIKFN